MSYETGYVTPTTDTTSGPLEVRRAPAAHQHIWRPVGFDPQASRVINGPTVVIQSCDCGEVRRVEVPR